MWHSLVRRAELSSSAWVTNSRILPRSLAEFFKVPGQYSALCLESGCWLWIYILYVVHVIFVVIYCIYICKCCSYCGVFFLFGRREGSARLVPLHFFIYVQMTHFSRLHTQPINVLLGLSWISSSVTIPMPSESNGNIYKSIFYVFMPCLRIILFNRTTQT